MKKNKNIIKGNRFADLKAVTKKNFYAVIDIKVTLKDGTTNTKSIVKTFLGKRLEAKQELEKEAKKISGKITYFGAFNN